VAKAFFPLLSKRYPGTWISVQDTGDKDKPKKLGRVDKDSEDIRGIVFDMWRQEHAKVDLEEVPADMVTTSASGLDPHITLKNGQYQLKYFIPEARVKKILAAEARKVSADFDKLDSDAQTAVLNKVRKALEDKVGKRLEDRLTEIIQDLLNQSASAPLGGLAGVPLINVLEMNVAMDKRVGELVEAGK
jgi:K+-transporting ATPase ATPase C chain